jgi:hypothetical protein
MPLVRAGMNGDAVGAEMFAVKCRLHYIGPFSTACIAQGGYFVDVNTEFDHGVQI